MCHGNAKRERLEYNAIQIFELQTTGGKHREVNKRKDDRQQEYIKLINNSICNANTTMFSDKRT
jgi:hypothetical protein